MQSIDIEMFSKKLSELSSTDLILDVRQPHEYEIMHIDGAKLIPLDALSDHIDEIKGYKTVYVHCRRGPRAKLACEILNDAGIRNTYYLAGELSSLTHKKFQKTQSKLRMMPSKSQLQLSFFAIALLSSILTFYDPWFNVVTAASTLAGVATSIDWIRSKIMHFFNQY